MLHDVNLITTWIYSLKISIRFFFLLLSLSRSLFVGNLLRFAYFVIIIITIFLCTKQTAMALWYSSIGMEKRQASKWWENENIFGAPKMPTSWFAYSAASNESHYFVTLSAAKSVFRLKFTMLYKGNLHHTPIYGSFYDFSCILKYIFHSFCRPCVMWQNDERFSHSSRKMYGICICKTKRMALTGFKSR